MFKQRLISGIFLVIILALTLYLGGDITLIVIGGVSLIGMYELFRVYQIEKCILGYISYLMAILYYAALSFDYLEGYLMMFCGLIMLLMAAYVFRYPKYQVDQVVIAFFGVFYVAIMLSYVYRLRTLPIGGYLVVLIFLSSWGCDTLAYCTGMLIGKHKMSPLLSPKKTIEGAIGGLIGAMLLGWIYSILIVDHIHVEYPITTLFPLVCGGGAIVSMIGDLAASAIKRNHNMKDYGRLIPGHGGILDRFDSMIFTAPVIFYLLLFLTRGALLKSV